MNHDMTVPCEEGLINLRVGAIIMKNGKILMVGNDSADYLYSVGGRIKFGETSEEAVIREVYEETGVKRNLKLHDPQSHFLIGNYTADDVIHDVVMESYVDRQMNLFQMKSMEI